MLCGPLTLRSPVLARPRARRPLVSGARMFLVEASPLSSSSGQNLHQPVTSTCQTREPVKARRSLLRRRQDGHPLGRALPPASPLSSSTPQFFHSLMCAALQWAHRKASGLLATDTSSPRRSRNPEPPWTPRPRKRSPRLVLANLSAVCPHEVHWQQRSSRCGSTPRRRPTGANPGEAATSAARRGRARSRAPHRTRFAGAMRRGLHAGTTRTRG